MVRSLDPSGLKTLADRNARELVRQKNRKDVAGRKVPSFALGKWHADFRNFRQTGLVPAHERVTLPLIDFKLVNLRQTEGGLNLRRPEIPARLDHIVFHR